MDPADRRGRSTVTALERHRAGFLALLLRADLRALEPAVAVAGARPMTGVAADLGDAGLAPGEVRVLLTADPGTAAGMAVRARTERSRLSGSSTPWVFVGRLEDRDGARLTGRFELPPRVRAFLMLYRATAWVFTGLVLLGAVVSLIRGELLRAGLLVLGAGAPLLMLLAVYALLAVSLHRSARQRARFAERLSDAVGAQHRGSPGGPA